MLRHWLGPDVLETFLRQHLGRLPCAHPGVAASAVSLLDWETFGKVLAADPPPDVLVAFCGRLIPVEQPRSLDAARRLLRQGLGLVIRRSERQSPVFANVRNSFAQELSGEVQVQLYATPAGTQTFGWHFDFEDVFVAQTVGVARDVTRTSQLDFSVIRNETSTTYSSRLIAGDWLYIPRRWWHLVRSIEDSLSISVGVMPVQELGVGLGPVTDVGPATPLAASSRP